MHASRRLRPRFEQGDLERRIINICIALHNPLTPSIPAQMVKLGFIKFDFFY
jgi:hypothetical protein